MVYKYGESVTTESGEAARETTQINVCLKSRTPVESCQEILREPSENVVSFGRL